MKSSKMSLGVLLMATTALVAPAFAAAQEAATDTTAQDTAAAEAAPVQEEAAPIIVRGKNLPNTMRRTAEVTSIITRDDLVRTGDDSAALALTRTTGISLVEGKFVYVRGLGERYSSALLNGNALPSPEPLQRVVPLDLFPSAILNRVAVQKTYSAEFPGEFGGGVVDLETVAVPREGFLTFGASTGGNSVTTFKKGFTHYGSDTDILGYDDGTRDVPDAVKAANATGKQINSANFTPAQLQTIGQSFTNAPLNLIQYTDHLPANFSVNASAGNAYDALGGKLGVIGVVDFSNSWQARSGINEVGQDEGSGFARHHGFDYDLTNNNVALSGLFGLGFNRDGHTLKWTNLYIHRTTKQTRVREGRNENGEMLRNDRTGWYERELALTQLSGSHPFGEQIRFDWSASHSVTSHDAPYEKSIQYAMDESSGTFTEGLYYWNPTASSTPATTSFSSLEDTVDNIAASVTYSFEMSEGRDGKITGGVYSLTDKRDFEKRDYRMTGSLPYPAQFGRVDFLFADYYIGPGGLEIQEITPIGAGYEASLDVQAAFIKADVEVIPLVRVAGGVRFESGKEEVVLRNLYQTSTPLPQTPAIENDYVLPSLTVTWNFAEDMQLRFGGSKTIGRPQFRELANPTYTDPDTNRSYFGNPTLVDTELVNLDARYEWYYDAGEYFTVGLFAKDIDKPVETVFGGSTLTQTFVNAPKAKLQGVEFDYKSLWASPDSFSGDFFQNKRWLFQANYTYTSSEVQVGENDKITIVSGTLAEEKNARDYIPDGSAMQGQSDHVANLQFGWEDATAKSQATFLVTYVSERISVRGSESEPEIRQEPGTQLDFTYRKEFEGFGRPLTFSLEARNLLNTEYQEFQEEGNGKVYVDRYEPGSSVSFGLSTKF